MAGLPYGEWTLTHSSRISHSSIRRPNPRPDRLEIGDIGFIDHHHGDFIILFRLQDLPQSGNIVPDFGTIEREALTDTNTFLANDSTRPLHASSVTAVSASASATCAACLQLP